MVRITLQILLLVTLSTLHVACSSGQKNNADGGIVTVDTHQDASKDLGEPDAETKDVSNKDMRPDVALTCAYLDPVVQGQVMDARMTEISGLAVSAEQNVIWVHNDSGEPTARFYALNQDGTTAAAYDLAGADSDDWEDAELVHDGGQNYLYFGDIGDNDARMGLGGRANITVYRVAEPNVENANPNVVVTLNDFETYVFTYPDAPHDSESVMVDPTTMDLYFVSKENSGPSNVYRAPKPVDGTTTELELLGTVLFGSETVPGVPYTTAGAISMDRGAFVIRTYGSIVQWAWSPNQSFIDAIQQVPIEIPRPIMEIQGEAVDFVNNGVITIGEGTNPRIYLMERRCE